MSPKPRTHQADAALDAARDLLVESGPRAMGMRGIAVRSGAPSGSLYHQFGSRDGLVARMWLRAVERFQAGWLAAAANADPVEAVSACAAWTARFALSQPGDARLLLAHSAADLLDGEPAPEVADALRDVNAPVAAAIRQLTERLALLGTPPRSERIPFAVMDLPYAVVRRHLLAGTLTDGVAEQLADAARALVEVRA